MSKARRFARNVSWNMAGQIVVAAANFLFIPYLVRGMGQERYGLYILLNTAASYLILLTFGAGDATVKFVAEHHGAQDGRALKDTLRYSLLMHGLAVVPGAAALFFGAKLCALRLFHVPQPLLPQAVFVLRCAAAGSISVAAIQFAGGVLQGLQRFDWHNLVTGLQNGLMPFGAAAAVWLGLGLAGAASWYVVLNALAAAAGLAAAWALLHPSRDLRAGKGLKAGVFCAYGASMWLSVTAWVVTFQFDKIFLARGTSLSDLTLYSIPSGLLQRVQVMGVVVSAVLLPMMSELGGSQAHEELIRIYLKSSRFLLWAVLPALILLFVLMPQFLTLWLGGEFGGRGVWPARLVVLAKLFFILDAIPNAVVCSRGKPWAMTAMVWAQAIISIAAWKLLVPRIGILGVAWGSLLAQSVPTVIYLLWLHVGVLRLTEGQYARQTLFAPAMSGLLLALAVFPLHPFVDDWPRLFGTVAGGLLLYYGSTWFLMDDGDKRLLKQILRREPAPAAGV
ncbi:MAG: oligosaccharide flippase family protein [Elusimicrobia bacterium]|nr:oligosaccharide flippase family protein [Elusimicrobiota bacterium]